MQPDFLLCIISFPTINRHCVKPREQLDATVSTSEESEGGVYYLNWYSLLYQGLILHRANIVIIIINVKRVKCRHPLKRGSSELILSVHAHFCTFLFLIKRNKIILKEAELYHKRSLSHNKLEQKNPLNFSS